MTSEPAAITRSEIASQPQMWSRAIAQARSGTALPAHDEPVIFIGCGTSYYIGSAYARVRQLAGGAPVMACIPSEAPALPSNATVIALSRSGTTGDVVELAAQLKDRHRIVSILGERNTPLERVSDDVVDLSYADETSVVQTRFASTAFCLLRSSVNPASPELDDLVEQANQALRRELPPVRTHVVYLGTGYGVGLAHEAALKCLESSGRWAEAYPIREYAHGPISAANEQTVVWPLSPIEPGLTESIADTGAYVVTPTFDPQAELVAAHRYAVAMALAAGRDPDLPPHLSRSVTTVSGEG